MIALVIASVPALTAPALAEDTVVTEANAAMDEVEKGIAVLTKGDAPKLNEINKALNEVNKKLKSAPRSDELAAALLRSKDLRSRANGAFSTGQDPGPAKPRTAPHAPTATARPEAGEKSLTMAEEGALKRISNELYMGRQILDKTPPEKWKPEHEEFVRGKLEKAEFDFARCRPGHPSTLEARATSDQLKADLDARVKAAKELAPGGKALTADVAAWRAELEEAKKANLAQFQDPSARTVKGLGAKLEALEARLPKIGNPEHPDAKEAAAALAEARKALEGALAGAKGLEAALGDWKAKLLEIEATLQNRGSMEGPVDEAKVNGWIDSLAAIEANIVAGDAFAERVETDIPAAHDGKEVRATKDKLFHERDQFKQNVSYWENDWVKDVGYADGEKVDDAVDPESMGRKREKIRDGGDAARYLARFYRTYRKDEAAAAEMDRKAAELTAKLEKLEKANEKFLDQVRLPKEIATPEMKKTLEQVVAGANWKKNRASDGLVALRLLVNDDRIHKFDTWEWYKGTRFHRDYDQFQCFGAFKNSSGQTRIYRFQVRFARADNQEYPLNEWVAVAWSNEGPIKEANVGK